MEFAVEPASKLLCQNDTLVSVNHFRQLSLNHKLVSVQSQSSGCVFVYFVTSVLNTQPCKHDILFQPCSVKIDPKFEFHSRVQSYLHMQT
jgi:hypothetical protein